MNDKHLKNGKKMKPFIIVTGMHRSGTSFLVRALNLCGMNIGDLESLTTTEWVSHKSNPKGHWENQDFINLGNLVLENNDGSWDNIPKQINIDELTSNKIKEKVKKFYSESSIATGFKDPNAILYFESWKKYFPENTIVVGIFRHPLKVCESLKNRNNFSYKKSLSLWKIYNERLLDIVEKENGILLNFDWEEKKLLDEIKQVCENIGLVPLDLGEWFAGELKRSDKTFDHNFAISAEIEEIYKKLQHKSKDHRSIIHDKSLQDTNLIDALKYALKQNKKQAEFFSKINKKNNNLIKNLKKESEPLSVLISLYNERPDLRKGYPEVDDGNYFKLIEWALFITHNEIVGEEESKNELSKHIDWYEQYEKNYACFLFCFKAYFRASIKLVS